jgi:hypothetical protein
MARAVRARFAKLHPAPLDFIFSEFAGGVEGAMGEYGRSRRRVAEIRRRVR